MPPAVGTLRSACGSPTQRRHPAVSMSTSTLLSRAGGLGLEKHSPPSVRPCFSEASAAGVGSGCLAKYSRRLKPAPYFAGADGGGLECVEARLFVHVTIVLASCGLSNASEVATHTTCAAAEGRARRRSRPDDASPERLGATGIAPIHSMRKETGAARRKLISRDGCRCRRLFAWSMPRRSAVSRHPTDTLVS